MIPADLSAGGEDDSKNSPREDVGVGLQIENKADLDPEFLAFEDDDNNRSIFSGNFQNSLNHDKKSNSSNSHDNNLEEDEDGNSGSLECATPNLEHQICAINDIEPSRRRLSQND